jgi:hypothetical protein
MPAPPRGRRQLFFLIGFATYFALIWFLWASPIVYPLKVFVILLHEVSHALAALATGGWVERIELSPALGGACYCPGGNALITLSSGYLGSLAWGALLLEWAQRSRRGTHRITQGLGGVVIVLTLLYVRGLFGMGFGLLFGGTLWALAPKLSTGANRTFLTFLGLTSSLYAILDIKEDVLDRPHLPSDAYRLGELTGVPTLAWGMIWIALAVAVSLALFLRAFRNA